LKRILCAPFSIKENGTEQGFLMAKIQENYSKHSPSKSGRACNMALPFFI